MIGDGAVGKFKGTGVAKIFARAALPVLAGTFALAIFHTAHGVEGPAKVPKPVPAHAEAKLDPAEWKRIVEAAKKEGKLVISGDPSEAWRKSLVDMFQEEYPEIKVEYTGLSGRNFWPRVRKEREFGQKLWDLRAGGVESVYSSPEYKGYLDPVRPLLLPEIADESKWIGGLDRLFYDKENKFLPAYTWYIQRPVAVNRDFIKESELKSSEQLLDPKFKGKIVMQTPTGGSTFAALGNLAFMYGEKFIRDLASRQNVVVTDDNRQQAEWVVRGRYPIVIGFNETQLIEFAKQGLGKNIKMLEDKVIPVTTGNGGICLLKDAPHPNAVKVYINWILSQKAQMNVTKSVLQNSRRTDVPPVDRELAVDPAHINSYYFYSTEEHVENSMRLLPLLKEAMRK